MDANVSGLTTNLLAFPVILFRQESWNKKNYSFFLAYSLHLANKIAPFMQACGRLHGKRKSDEAI